MTEQDLIAAGYKFFPDKRKGSRPGLYQKCIEDNFHKHYFITIEMFDWREYKEKGHFTNFGDFSFAPTVQFHVNDDVRVNVEYIVNTDTTVEDVEKFYLDMYERMKFVPYEST